jgi:hypothetical protein
MDGAVAKSGAGLSALTIPRAKPPTAAVLAIIDNVAGLRADRRRGA